MKFTLSWLREHLETHATLDDICTTLNRIGIEVEKVENKGAALEPFLTARILKADPHPNADRLQVCLVDAGPGFSSVQVVCGAPNAREGLAVIFAPPGTYVPGLNITIKKGVIRGEHSGGMLCSLQELGLGEESQGIAELPEDTFPGQSYADFAGLDDVVIEVAITPNRGDALGVRGIARDLAAAGLGTLRPWLQKTVEDKFASPLTWAITYHEACPWVLGRAVRGVRNGASPEWLRRRLESIGLRPVSALVDITNYFCFDLGRPLHVFDIKKITGSCLTIDRGHGQTLRALDGKDYVLSEKDCIIADEAGAQSIAGIMGGEATSVDENTTEVFIECALFDPVHIAMTKRRLGISSDSSYRFERGVDPALPMSALEAATCMIVDLCGGEASAVVAAGQQPYWQREASLRFNQIKHFGGLDLPPCESVAVLEKLGFEVMTCDESALRVRVPSWRNDIAQTPILSQAEGLSTEKAARVAEPVASMEAERDLIEEILRIKGIDSVPVVSLPPLPFLSSQESESVKRNSHQAKLFSIRRLLSARGLTEAVSFSFVASERAARFEGTSENLRLLNPIASDLNQMRPTPLVSLIEAVRHNSARGWSDIGLFEIGPAFTSDVIQQGQQTMIVGVRSGYTPRYPGVPSRAVSFDSVKADLLEVLQQWGVSLESLTTSTGAPSWYHPGRSGVLRQGKKGNIFARFGELHPALLQSDSIDVPVVAFEVLCDVLPPSKHKKKQALKLSPFQPVKRDFTFVVAQDIPAENLIRAVREADRQLISHVRLFGVYDPNNPNVSNKWEGRVLKTKVLSACDNNGDILPVQNVQNNQDNGDKQRLLSSILRYNKKNLKIESIHERDEQADKQYLKVSSRERYCFFMSVEVTLQPMERSLTESDLEAISHQIVKAVEKTTGGTLRS